MEAVRVSVGMPCGNSAAVVLVVRCPQLAPVGLQCNSRVLAFGPAAVFVVEFDGRLLC